jgi:hypothetical protein
MEQMLAPETRDGLHVGRSHIGRIPIAPTCPWSLILMLLLTSAMARERLQAVAE